MGRAYLILSLLGVLSSTGCTAAQCNALAKQGIALWETERDPTASLQQKNEAYKNRMRVLDERKQLMCPNPEENTESNEPTSSSQ